MGIRELNKILANAGVMWLELEELARFAQQPINVSLDGLQFIHAGARTDFCDERQIAESAFHSIDELLCRIEQKCPVNSVGFYMDGAVPRAKHRSVETEQYKFSLALARYHLYELLTRQLPKVYIIDLSIGEAEHVIFAHRDATRPNLLVTNDTDAFHITYKYRKQSSPDIVLLTNTSLNKLYNMATLTLNVPKLAFAVIAFAKGSDFTEQIFNGSMCVALLQIFADKARTPTPLFNTYIRQIEAICEKYERAESQIQHEITQQQCSVGELYDIKDVQHIVSVLLLMLIVDSQSKPCTFNWSKPSKAVGQQTMSTHSYLRTLTWGVNYSLLGSNIANYQSGPADGNGKGKMNVNVYGVFLDVLATNTLWAMPADDRGCDASYTTFKQRWLNQQR